ncbi:HEPN-associated N-terminal domain-containing protein [Pseudarthrobacter cellobiosi]|uniref:HEPN-associated N-terminal domain-containing protein n=1 Tax=Pseudarthrobacter cellobiosi TaxID=2953654 RepID=UPI00208DF60B|nr:HEPN-associated N-terminal domain-containing protein [Pseudarthrobacter sp. HLT1-5]MCO4253822.1 RES domain-containing protein [Pseudarthrobacter sp. HLT1-5]
MSFTKRYLEQMESRGFQDLEGSICLSHIEDTALRETLTEEAEDAKCRICDNSGPGVALNNLMTEVMEAIEFLYEPSDKAGLFWDREDGWMGADVLESYDVLEDACSGVFADDVEAEVMDLLVESMDHEDWTANRHSSSLEATEWAWEQFVSDVKSESRFVFSVAKSSEGFGTPGERSANFLGSLLTYVEDAKLKLMIEVPEGTDFYRGRLVNHGNEKMAAAKKLGPAPADKAAANRMSPEGIPMFYGSASAETAIREIAAHGTSEYARIGAFRSRRPLTLLDLTALPKLPSIFDKEARNRNGVLRFFKHFANNVTAPIRPDGRQHVDYVPTQVVTEFFRWVPSVKIDGIKLRSAQDGQDTFVLFFTQQHVEDERPEDDQEREGAEKNEDAPGFDFGAFEPEPPVLTLNVSDVRTYRIIRQINSEPI